MKGLVLSLLLLTSIITISSFNEIYAQESPVSSKSVGFEETTVIEFENKESTEIKTIRIWLGSDFAFKSFKTEKDWTGKKSPQGVIIFTTTEPLKKDEVVKFGVKSDKPKPAINWKVLDSDDEVVETGLTVIPEIYKPTEKATTSEAIFEESVFKIIPEKPSVGSSIRVSGQSFGANQILDFYINEKKIETLETDDDGNFIITTKIPDNISADRTTFTLEDVEGVEKKISLRIGEDVSKIGNGGEKIHLTINGLPETIFRGKTMELSGTATPDSTLTATIKDEDGKTVTTITVDVDAKGKWSYEQIIPPNAPLGKRTTEITDGEETILRQYTITASEKIKIIPIKQKFEPGEPIAFNGTVATDQELELVLEDPSGSEFASQIIKMNSSDIISFEFPTLVSSLEGTYVLTASQGTERAIVLAGLGELPQEVLVVKPDKLNYKAGDMAIIELKGPSSSTLSFLLLDPSDQTKFSDSVVLGVDGGANYELDLKSYASGVYTIVVTRANSQVSTTFAVGLQTGSGPIEMRTTKDSFQPGESVLVLGESGKNILITLIFSDPDGNEIKLQDTFTNKEGTFSDNSFRIPLNAQQGTWVVTAKSGQNQSTVEIDVVTELHEGLTIRVGGEKHSPGELVFIQGFNAGLGQSVFINIITPNGEELPQMKSVTTGEGSFSFPWNIPKDFELGEYTIKANDATQEAEIKLILE